MLEMDKTYLQREVGDFQVTAHENQAVCVEVGLSGANYDIKAECQCRQIKVQLLGCSLSEIQASVCVCLET